VIDFISYQFSVYFITLFGIRKVLFLVRLMTFWEVAAFR